MNLEPRENYAPPIAGCKAVIAPYAPIRFLCLPRNRSPKANPATQDTRTRGRPLLGLTNPSILLECRISWSCMLRSLTDNLRKRVFVLGPSHHVYLDGCALSKCKTYATPVGDLPLDLESGSLLSLPSATRLIAACSHRRIARNGEL